MDDLVRRRKLAPLEPRWPRDPVHRRRRGDRVRANHASPGSHDGDLHPRARRNALRSAARDQLRMVVRRARRATVPGDREASRPDSEGHAHADPELGTRAGTLSPELRFRLRACWTAAPCS